MDTYVPKTTIGITCFALLLFYYAFSMTVAIDGTYNVGLLSARQNVTIVASALLVCGIILQSADAIVRGVKGT